MKEDTTVEFDQKIYDKWNKEYAKVVGHDNHWQERVDK
jgi:hypothetical protein